MKAPKQYLQKFVWLRFFLIGSEFGKPKVVKTKLQLTIMKVRSDSICFSVNTHRLLVPSPVIRGKCAREHTHSKSHDKIHQPEPAKQMVDLHAEQVTIKPDRQKHQLSE